MKAGTPYWLSDRESSLQEENARRISRQLTGKHKISMGWIIRKMRWRYSRYGKRSGRTEN